MAKTTPAALRSALIYCAYPRNHSAGGGFSALLADLDRIRGLGTDILWLLPIHPTGEKNRKGSLGSPYAVRDYREINRELGTLADFVALVEAVHSRGMRLMMDVVYNHTSPDSVLIQQHPEWFYRDANGNFGNRAGSWSDVVDLDYTHRDLWDYQIETLCYWAGLGVDGFRCDVASAVPVDFWVEARRRVEEVRPGVVWLAESVHPYFVEKQRRHGFYCASDAELYQAFDLTYDYDIHDAYADIFAPGAGAEAFAEALAAQASAGEKVDGEVQRLAIAAYLRELQRQGTRYPEGILKLRSLENHDQPRAARLIPCTHNRRTWMAFTYFLRGTAMLYAGQEAHSSHVPSLFDQDPVDWSNRDEAFEDFLRRLKALREHPVVQDGLYGFLPAAEHPSVATVWYRKGVTVLCGVFNLGGECGRVAVPLPDGVYQNLLTGVDTPVSGGSIALTDGPVILESV